MNDEATHEGGCLCGAIRYRILEPMRSVAHCHCAMCRRASGGTAVTWVTVAVERVAVTRGQPAVYRSSEHAERQFCPTCGAQLTFWSKKHPREIDVTLATLDHASDHPADHHVWTRSRLPWLHLDEHLAIYELPPRDEETNPGKGACRRTGERS